MFSIARAAILSLLLAIPALALAQTGPSAPQVIAAASTAKIKVGSRDLAGQAVATVRVDEEGNVSDVQLSENTTEPAFEPYLLKVFRSARFRPAIDAAGKVIAANIDMKIELRQSTGSEPKPTAANTDPQLTDQEKVRIRKMKCADFVWEWDLIRHEAGDATAMEFMPRIAVSMYAAMRTEAGEYVDAKVWKASAKALKQSADHCRDEPAVLFWDGMFKGIMDEAVPK